VSDLVLFAGPVVLKAAFDRIAWRTDVRVVAIPGTGSSYFGSLGVGLRDQGGRVLPNLLRRYAGGGREDFDKVALAAYSAGWGLLNQVCKQEADRREVDALIATDAAFGTGLSGYEAYAADAIQGRGLMVGTSTNNSANWAAGIYKTARETWEEIIDGARARAGVYCLPKQQSARPPMPEPSGGVWRVGSSLYWYDYVVPGSDANTGNDFTHGEHHDLAPLAWEAYLVPLFAADWRTYLGALLAAGGLAAAWRIWRGRWRGSRR
jgi:hypothetical protein